ncbi:MAG: glycosyltransferase family 4 protein [Candidatus Wenzhouxiangella sp. M2_3B_020]
MSAPGLLLVVPGDPDQPTGGYRYDARIADELRSLGWSIDVIGLPGRFPDADDEARAALDDVLSLRSEGATVVVDGLALGGLPDVAERHARRLDLVALVHHPLADESGLSEDASARFLALERRALAACRRVVTTSRFTAARLAAAMDVPASRLRVVEPGVEPAPAATDPRRAAEERPQRLLCVGSLVPRKAQDVLVDALAPLAERDWSLELVGDAGRDPAYAEALRENVESRGLGDRVRFAGVRMPEQLDADYGRADVLVVPSRYEGYGMVVTEALARGLPLIATDGGALADTVPDDCALRVPVGDRVALTDALETWLTEPALRARLVAAALERRERLDDWPAAGRGFAAALESREVSA